MQYKQFLLHTGPSNVPWRLTLGSSPPGLNTGHGACDATPGLAAAGMAAARVTLSASDAAAASPGLPPSLGVPSPPGPAAPPMVPTMPRTVGARVKAAAPYPVPPKASFLIWISQFGIDLVLYLSYLTFPTCCCWILLV